MDTRVVTPHDDLFHFAFQHPRHTAPWLRCVLPATMAPAIDWQSLQPAPEKLRGHPLRLSIADLVFRAERAADRSPVWFVIEHKANDAAQVQRQVLRYSIHLDERTRSSRAATTVVGVVFHHGTRPFLEHGAATGDPFAPFQPRMRLIVDDIGRTSEAALRARSLTPLGTLATLCLRFLPHKTDSECVRSFERWGDLLRAVDRDSEPPLGHDAIAKIAWYALTVVDVTPRDLHATFERLLQRPEDTIMGTLERTYQKGRIEGRVEGRVEGRADTILRQLQKRFGPLPAGTTERVRAGSEADLDRWTDRILDAKSLAEVLAD